MGFRLYKDADGKYHWRLVAVNGRVYCDSIEGYYTKAACEEAIEQVKVDICGSETHDDSGEE